MALNPDTFRETAEKALAAAVSSEGESRQQLATYRDYRNKIDSVENLPDDVAIHLIIRLARLNAVKDAEEIATSLYQRKTANSLFENALTILSQTLRRQNDDNKAGGIAAMVENLHGRQQPLRQEAPPSAYKKLWPLRAFKTYSSSHKSRHAS